MPNKHIRTYKRRRFAKKGKTEKKSDDVFATADETRNIYNLKHKNTITYLGNEPKKGTEKESLDENKILTLKPKKSHKNSS